MTHDDTDRPATFGLREIAAIVVRWRHVLVGGLLLGLLVGGILAVVLPPVYRSAATLLIRSQDIPITVVASPLNEVAEARVGRIREQILGRRTLWGLIVRNGLYTAERRTMTPDAVMAILRDAIAVDLVGAQAGEGQQGQNATIAFTLAYANRDPQSAFHVADQLTDMFVSQDARLRTEQMAGAATFLVRRADELRDRLVEMEARRRAIEARYNGALPDQIALSAQSTSALRSEISRMDAEAQGVAQQNGLLAARSQDVAPPAPTPAQLEYARAQARLDQVSAVYSDSHPDVVAARAALALAQAAVRRDPPPRSLTAPLEQEIASGRARIAALAARRAGLVAEVSRADRQVSLAPQATYELNNLQREYDNLKQQYQSIREKQLDAQVAVNLQVEGKGERFSVVDRATLPLAPVSPRRVRLVTTGALVGIAVAIGFLLMWEMTMRPIHGPGAVVALTGEEPLAEIATLRAGPFASLRTRVARALSWRRRAVPT